MHKFVNISQNDNSVTRINLATYIRLGLEIVTIINIVDIAHGLLLHICTIILYYVYDTRA